MKQIPIYIYLFFFLLFSCTQDKKADRSLIYEQETHFKNMRQLTFETASEAFNFYYGTIPYEGVDFAGTKAMFNQGFLIEKPWLRIIDNEK